jgi:hypothetical protein
MSYIPTNQNGQATKANSQPVTLASDQNNALETGGNLAQVATNTTNLNNIVGTSGSAVQTKGILVQGSNGTNAQNLSTDGSGNLNVNVVSAVNGSGSQQVVGTLAANPTKSTAALAVRPVPNTSWRCTFATVQTNTVDSSFFTLLGSGSGQTINQTGGNLVIASGTTANSETTIRSVVGWSNTLVMRYAMMASQRIANNNLIVELVDVIGDTLSLTVNSATSVTITIPSNPFTSANVGQSLTIHTISGVSAAIPGRYAIASVSGNNVTFTVAGWPASGSGTCSLTGWNYHQIVYTSTTATNNTYDAQRRGYNSGATTTNINTTASPGHIGSVFSDLDSSYYSDSLAATNLGYQLTQRASRFSNIPADDATLYMQIRSLNGSTAPASSTTWTVGFASVMEFIKTPVSVFNQPQMGIGTGISTIVQNTPAVTISSGTVSTVSSVTQDAVALPVESNPISSAAITTTTTTALSPTNGAAVIFQLNCTAVTGTTPTMDVQIQESLDNGATYFCIYQFPRITASISTPYFSPPLKLRGSKIQCVQTVAGTSPSFTRALFMDQVETNEPVASIRSITDRSISLTTLNSTTNSGYGTGGGTLLTLNSTSNVEMILNISVAGSGAATVQLQKSEDGGTTWINIGTAITQGTTTGTFTTGPISSNANTYRATTTTAGTGITLGWLQIKAW